MEGRLSRYQRRWKERDLYGDLVGTYTKSNADDMVTLGPAHIVLTPRSLHHPGQFQPVNEEMYDLAPLYESNTSSSFSSNADMDESYVPSNTLSYPSPELPHPAIADFFYNLVKELEPSMTYDPNEEVTDEESDSYSAPTMNAASAIETSYEELPVISSLYENLPVIESSYEDASGIGKFVRGR